MIVDFHTHIYPDKIAERAINNLEQLSGYSAHTDGTLDGLKASMRPAKISRSVNLPVATKPEQTETIIKTAEKLNEDSGIISFAGIHPGYPNYKSALNEIQRLKIKGIKIHPDYQGCMINDTKLTDLIKYALEIGLIVVTHAGFDPYSPDLVHCPPEMVAGILPKLPCDGIFVVAHIGGIKEAGDTLKYLAGTGVYFDTALAEFIPDRDTLIRILKNHDPRRILFGTDSPWSGQLESAEFIKTLDLGKDYEDLIFYKNAQRILGLNEGECRNDI